MNRVQFRPLVFLLMLITWLSAKGSIAFGQEPEVLVELVRNRIFEGESVKYSVTLNNCEDTAKPTLPEVKGIQFRQAGVTVMRQTIFNGFKRISIGGPRYEYVLTPSGSGEFKIPGPTVVVDGKTYRGQPATLLVTGPNEQDLAVLEMSTSRDAVYPLQPFTVRLKVALKGLPDPYTGEDPLRGTGGEIPVLTIPWADDDDLPEGVTPDMPAARWLKALLPTSRRTVGFGVNNYRFDSDDLFAMFSESRRAMFRPEPERVKRKDSQGRTVDYWEFTFERSLTASKIGSISLGPVSLKGTFATRVSPGGGVDVEEVYTIAKPLKVEVRDVPLAGRPDSYIGAIGRVDVQADLTPTSVKVGDPMTLSLRVNGQGTLQNAFAPKLEQMPEIAENFKVYEATEQSGNEERTFTYGLRPRQAGLKAFPPIEVAYFDYESEKYVTLKTPAIKIQVAESDRVADRDIAISEKSQAAGPAIESVGAGIFANITDVGQIRDERVHPDFWFISLAGMAGTFVLCSLFTRQMDRRRSDPKYARRRGAAKRAQATLADARRLSTAGSRREAIESLRSAVTGLIADAGDSSDASMTSREAAQNLLAIGISTETSSRCQQLLDEFDAARYGNSSHSLEEQVRSAEGLVADLLRELRNRKIAL